MLPSDKLHILEDPINELPLSSSFKKVMHELHLNTLKDVIDKPVPDLLKMPGFSIRVLVELTNFLEDHKLAHLLNH